MTNAVICIAGAHRSGTSMLTRLLHRCGLYLGPENELMPAAADNPDGFWEHLRFVQLNDEILNEVGAAWDLPPWKEQTFKGSNLRPLRAKAELLIKEFGGRSIWGWKDPRNSLTLPFWRSLLPDLKVVVIIRNPLEVAYSMRQRNGTSYALGLRLWEIYNRRLLAATDPQKRIITNYDAFFADPHGELRRIATFAGLAGETEIGEAAALVAVRRRHTSFTLEQMIDAGTPESISALYQSLLEGETCPEGPGRRASGGKRDQLAGAEIRLTTSVPDSESVRQELATRRGAEIQHREEIARHQQTIDQLRRELASNSVRAAAEINRRDGRIEELQKAFAHLDQILQGEQTQRNQLYAELERVRHDTREQLEAARQQLDRDQNEIAQVRERFVQTNQLLQKNSIRLAEFETRNLSLSERLRKQLMEMKRLLRLLDQIDNASGLLRRSRRWKLANPFSALLAAFTGKPLRGFGHLDRNVEKYRAWRSDHPEIAALPEAIQALRPREILSPISASETGTSPATPPSAVKPPSPKNPVSFAQHDSVDVSIIIPVYNQVEFTHACLASLQEHSGNIPYEVIIVDDGSTDGTAELIGSIPGVTCLRTDKNSGFIFSCNRGAQAARGEFLVFLNNDTTVTDGWLAALRETFEFEPQAGLVGSKLVYPDGRLQEAGGIIWRDGSGWNRGKFQDPDKPEYNYLREVDYCSAASVMIPKSLFETLGGFDLKYAPAYYEDTDLAFKVAQNGRKVFYQPLSVVFHYEGVTGGTDIASGTKRHQEINRDTFVSAWSTALESKPENGDLAAYESLQPEKLRILVIDHHLPMPDRDSGSLRMFQILTLLHRLGHRVTFLPDNMADLPPYAGNLRKRGIQVMHHPYLESIRQYLQSDGSSFDVIILSRCDFARKHVADVRTFAPQARLIFDTVDLHFLREARLAEMTNDPELRCNALQKQQVEFDLIDQADQTWVVSPAEQSLLLSRRPNSSIEVVSNIVDTPGSTTPFAQRRDILFIGSFQHPPNADAVLFFTQEIFPLVQGALPEVRFYVIGDKPPPEVIALASEEVIITGYQPDVEVFFNTIKLSVAPLRYGAGVKGKINQSMGFGVPVVATPVAVEGMSLKDGKEVLIAEEPAVFAERLIELYLSEELWQRISLNGITKTEELFSADVARQQLEKILGMQRTHHLSGSAGLGRASQPVTA